MPISADAEAVAFGGIDKNDCDDNDRDDDRDNDTKDSDRGTSRCTGYLDLDLVR
jgi:hypothetical protein